MEVWKRVEPKQERKAEKSLNWQNNDNKDRWMCTSNVKIEVREYQEIVA